MSKGLTCEISIIGAIDFDQTSRSSAREYQKKLVLKDGIVVKIEDLTVPDGIVSWLKVYGKEKCYV